MNPPTMTHISRPAISWKKRPTDNADVFWFYSGKPIIHLPTEADNRIATEQLFSLFDKQYPEDNVTLLPTELITRRSCGCNT